MRLTSRRRFIGAAGGSFVVGTLAGCTGGGNGDADDDDGEEDLLADHLSNARGYDGQLQDSTGETEVTVENGAGSDGLAFDPAGLRIDAGTTVVWEWTGRGGGHDVASVRESDFSFQSDRTDRQGHTFEHTFDEAGIALYVCQPHQGQRMKGGIEVV